MEECSVYKVDFTKHENALVHRFNVPEEVGSQGFTHLRAILDDAQKNIVRRYYALPYAADQAMHVVLLDSLFLYKISEKLFGTGKLIAHDPFPPEGPAREVAWNNTCEALAKVGVAMPSYADALKNQGGKGPFDPEACWLWIEPLAA